MFATNNDRMPSRASRRVAGRVAYGESTLHMGGLTGSIPVAPTIFAEDQFYGARAVGGDRSKLLILGTLPRVEGLDLGMDPIR